MTFSKSNGCRRQPGASLNKLGEPEGRQRTRDATRGRVRIAYDTAKTTSKIPSFGDEIGDELRNRAKVNECNRDFATVALRCSVTPPPAHPQRFAVPTSKMISITICGDLRH